MVRTKVYSPYDFPAAWSDDGARRRWRKLPNSSNGRWPTVGINSATKKHTRHKITKKACLVPFVLPGINGFCGFIVVVVLLTDAGNTLPPRAGTSRVRLLHHANADSCDRFVVAVGDSARARVVVTARLHPLSATPPSLH